MGNNGNLSSMNKSEN